MYMYTWTLFIRKGGNGPRGAGALIAGYVALAVVVVVVAHVRDGGGARVRARILARGREGGGGGKEVGLRARVVAAGRARHEALEKRRCPRMYFLIIDFNDEGGAARCQRHLGCWAE